MNVPLSNLASIGQVVATVSNWKLVNVIRDTAIDILVDTARTTGKKELSDRFARLRSDASLQNQIQDATVRAAKRWAEDYPDRELIAAVAENTSFADLPAVREAARTLARNPFDPVPAEALNGKFAQVLPQRFESSRIEQGIANFLEILREEFAGVPELRAVLGLVAEIQTARASKQTAALAGALPEIETILKRMEGGPTSTEQTLRDYLTWVVDQHRYLDPRGTIQPARHVQVRLEEIYVPLEACLEPSMDMVDRRLLDDELDILTKREDLTATEKQDLRDNLMSQLHRNEEPRSNRPMEMLDLIRERPKVIVLGDPGSGKTTLLRYLALRHAQALQADQKNLPELGTVRLPLYLRLATYAEYGAGRSLGEFLMHSVRGEADSDPALAVLIRERLARGECIVLLDGLDEVIELSERGEIAQQVDALIRSNEKSGNRFVVTSRVAGYRTTPISGDIPHVHICEMNDKQIRYFVQRWCRAVEHFQTPDLSSNTQNQNAQREIDGIIRAITQNPGVRRLAANPLLLRTLALIHRNGARLPQRRVELYGLAADILIRNWELARGIPETALVREADANRLLAELAAWIHDTKPAGVATEGEVREKLSNVVGAVYGKEPEHPDAQTAVSDFLSRIRQHTGLFVERLPRRYGFMHLTFEEYFSARWLIARPRDAARRIRAHLHRPRWEEPILLAIAYYGMEFPDGVSELVEEALMGKDLGGPSPFEELLHRDLIFALRCMGDQDVSVGLRRQITSTAVGLWMNYASTSRYEPIQERLAQTLRDIQDSQAGNALRDELVVSLHDQDVRVREAAAYALRNAKLSKDAVLALLTAAQDENKIVRDCAMVTLSTALLSAEAVTTLLDTLRDKNNPARASAADALGNAALSSEAVITLQDALRDENSQIRASAADALGNATLSADATLALLIALRDRNGNVRASAAKTLGRATASNEVIAALLDALHDKIAKVRANAAEALNSATLSTEAIEALFATLSDENSKVRTSAAETLGNSSISREALPTLFRGLNNDSERVRASAVAALRNTTLSAEAVSALLGSLRDEDKTVRDRAAMALSNAPLSSGAVSALLVALSDRNEFARVCAIDALRNATARPDVVTAILNALNDEMGEVRAHAAAALGNTTLSTEAILTLLDALRDENSQVRANAAAALSNATLSVDAINGLLGALRDKNGNVRANAASTLGHAAFSSEVITALLAALSDKVGKARANAADALSSAVTRPDVVTALLAAMRDEDPNVRASAAFALRDASSQPEVVTALLGALTDRNTRVRASAANALHKAPLHEETISALLPALCNENEHVRAGAVSALSNATISAGAIEAILNRLRDENEYVRARASDAVAQLVRQPAARSLPGLPEQIANVLKLPEWEHASGFRARHPHNSLLEALDAVAPPPSV